MNTAVTISFNKTTNSYTLSSYPLSATATRPAETKSLTSIYLGQGIIIDSLPGGGTTYTLTFLTRGLLSPSPTAQLPTVTQQRRIRAGLCLKTAGDRRQQ